MKDLKALPLYSQSIKCFFVICLVSSIKVVARYEDNLRLNTDENLWIPPDNRTFEDWMEHHGMTQDQYRHNTYLMKLYIMKLASKLSIEVDPKTVYGSDGGMIYNKEQLLAFIADLDDDAKSSVTHISPKRMKRMKRKAYDFDKYGTRKWQLPVPYKFSGEQSASDLEMIHAAMKEWERMTCINFREVEINEPMTESHILFTSNQERGCSSYVGRQVYIKPQKLNLAPGSCTAKLGTVVHEIGHSLGLYHEHNRKDRDEYVTVGKNMDARRLINFMIKSRSDSLNVSYDYGSVFHYGSDDFSNNGRKTLIAKDPLSQPSLGQRVTLSFLDALLVNKAYCKGFCAEAHLCQNGGFPDPNNCSRCICPEGLGGSYCDNAKESDGGCSPEPYGDIDVRSDKEECITSRGFADGKSYRQSGDECNYLLKAPPGCKIQARFAGPISVYGRKCNSSPLCYHWVEIKHKADLSLRGPRFCCNKTLSEAVESETNHMIVSFDARYPIVETTHKKFYRPPYTSERKGFKLCYKLADTSCVAKSEVVPTLEVSPNPSSSESGSSISKTLGPATTESTNLNEMSSERSEEPTSDIMSRTSYGTNQARHDSTGTTMAIFTMNRDSSSAVQMVTNLPNITAEITTHSTGSSSVRSPLTTESQGCTEEKVRRSRRWDRYCSSGTQGWLIKTVCVKQAFRIVRRSVRCMP